MDLCNWRTDFWAVFRAVLYIDSDNQEELWFIRSRIWRVLCMYWIWGEFVATRALVRRKLWSLASQQRPWWKRNPKRSIPRHLHKFAPSSLQWYFKSLFYSRALCDFRTLKVTFFNIQVVYFKGARNWKIPIAIEIRTQRADCVILNRNIVSRLLTSHAAVWSIKRSIRNKLQDVKRSKRRHTNVTKESADNLKSEQVMAEGEESFIGSFCRNESFTVRIFSSLNMQGCVRVIISNSKICMTNYCGNINVMNAVQSRKGKRLWRKGYLKGLCLTHDPKLCELFDVVVQTWQASGRSKRDV